MLVGVAAEDGAEERRAGRENHFMSLQLRIVLASQRHVEEVFLVSNFSKGAANISFKVIPPETEFLR